MTGSLRSVLIKLGLFTAITLSLTGLLAAVIGNIQPFTRFYTVRAQFSDATGLLKTDAVKIAGVTVGKVAGADVEMDGRTGKARALVTFRVKRNVDIPNNARAAIRFRNLLGQRMIVISRDKEHPNAPSFPKSGENLIPLSRTSPAFDLGIVFNNLKPVLRTLSAGDVNTISRAIVKVFGGREQRLQDMTAQLADVTEALGARGPVVTEVVEHLSDVVSAIAAHDDDLGGVVDSLDRILGTLAGRSTELARAAENIGVAGRGTAKILEDNRPGLDEAIHQLTAVLGVVAEERANLDAAVRNLPLTVEALNRATTYGEWVNLNGVCINGLCGPGFSSNAATESKPGSQGVLENIFAAAYQGGDR